MEDKLNQSPERDLPEEPTLPEDDNEDIEVETVEENDLAVKLEEALARQEEFKEALQRERADFSNFRKRIDRERGELRSQIVADTISRMLPVFDDLQRAIENAPGEFKENDWFQGVELIGKKFGAVLDSYGIEPINPLGEPFDHNFHEAIGSDDSDEYASGTVIDVVQTGYKMNGKCIRPAMVRVAN
ncbi:MAG: nucleotide exchange factor GrpE [Chloroflexi bacterium]|nr:nucleotide exchange factor GrpE [Chloroflexota bacterium]